MSNKSYKSLDPREGVGGGGTSRKKEKNTIFPIALCLHSEEHRLTAPDRPQSYSLWRKSSRERKPASDKEEIAGQHDSTKGKNHAKKFISYSDRLLKKERQDGV